MSAVFQFWLDRDGTIDRLIASVGSDGTLSLTAADKARGESQFSRSMIDLPASDARRLRDWLNERYPVTESGETK